MILGTRKYASLLFLFFISFSIFSNAQIDKRKNALELLSEGYENMIEGDSSKALKYFASVAPNDTGYFLANYFSNSIYFGFKNYDRCLDLANIGLENYQDRESDFFIQKGNALLELDRFQEALEVYETALEKYPLNHILHYNRAKAYKNLKNYNAYLASLKKAVSIYPYYAPAHRELGYAAENSGNISQALMSFVMSILVDPSTNAANSVLVHIDELVTDKFTVDKDAHSFDFPGDDYSEIDLMIRNYVALQKGYKAKSKAKLDLIKQLQLMMEQLEYNPKDNGYWMTTYVKFYTNLWKEDLFENFSYYILKASNSDRHQKLVRKKSKKIAKFSDWAGAEIKSYFNTLPVEIYGKEFVGTRGYGAYGLSGLSSIGKEKNGSLQGQIYYIHPSGAIKGEGVLLANGKPNGNWKWYTRRGELETEYEITNGLLQNWYKNYHPNGKISEEINFKNDLRHGIYKSYYLNGGISSKQNYKNGNRDGEMIFYHNSGQVEYKFYRVNNEIDGTFKRFYSNGNLRLIQSYTDGKRDSASTQYYHNGQMKSRLVYEDDVLNGPYDDYFINGKLERKGSYKDGSQSGENVDYWSNGNLYQKNTYDQDGKKNGLSQEFDKDGGKYLEFDYKKGNVIAYRIFDKSGEIVKSGKKRGGEFLYESLYPDGSMKSVGLYNSKGGNEGDWKFYDKNGKLNSKESYDEGLRIGKGFGYHPNGKIRYESEYTEGSWNGMYRSFYNTGQLESEIVGEDGVAERWKVYYSIFGDTTALQYYYQGEQQGWQYNYTVDGKLDFKSYMQAGVTQIEVICDTSGNPQDTLEYFGEKSNTSYYPNGQKKYLIHSVNGVNQGEAIWYYGNGQISVKGNYKDGLRVGDWKSYYANGQVSIEYSYVHGTRHGKTISYNKAGLIDQTYTYVYGDLDGVNTFYSDKGKVTNVYNYEMGSRHGMAKFHDPEGNLEHVRYYNYGKIIGYSYEGSDGKLVEMIPIKDETAVVKSYFSNGKLGRQYELDAGEFVNEYLEYYSNGQLSETSVYKDGKMEGLNEEYFKNGNVKESCMYEKGLAQGHSKEYYSNKVLKSDHVYLNGVLHGEAKIYSKNGKLISTQYFYDGQLISETITNP